MSPEITWWGVGLAFLWVGSVVFAYQLGRTVGLEDAIRRMSAAARREWRQAQEDRQRWDKWTN